MAPQHLFQTMLIKKQNRYYSFVLSLSVILISGCGYPEVSPQTYDLANALYTACNLKNDEQLSKVKQLIEESLSEEQLTKREAAWLLEIVKNATAGNWEEAASEARQLIKDQVHEQ